MNQFTEGQAMVALYENYRGEMGEPRPVVITKIGRKWVSIEGDRYTSRFNRATLQLDGGEYSAPGQVYYSMEACQLYIDLKRSWAELRTRTDKAIKPPEGVTAQRVRLALGLIRMGGDTDPLAVVQALIAKLPEAHVQAYFAREELAAVRRLFA